MTGSAPAQLVGGPFDGDKGGVVLPLPDVMYVWSCKTPARHCPSNGIHWERVPRRVAEVYRIGQVEDGVQIYVHEDLELQSRDSLSAERPAPQAVAHAA